MRKQTRFQRVGVGTMIAHDPLHRSGRAELPHPAPTLGEDAQAHERIRMTNTSRWKPSRNIAPHAAPGQVVTLAATSQYRPPQVTRRLAKSAQRRAVQGHPVIAEMPQQDRAQVRSLFPNGRVQASPQFFFQSPQLSLPPLAHRLSQYREMSLPGFPAAVRKTQEVERFRFAVATSPSVGFRIAAKFDDSRFVSMQLESKPRATFAQFCQKPLRFLTMLKSRNKVIGKTHEDYLPARWLPSPSLDPEVEYVVQVDVRQQRADTPALNRSYLALYSLALFPHARLEPFLDQAHDAPVGYAVLDELYQPSLIESVIKLPDVGIKHPVHFSRSDANRQRVQRLMRTVPRSKSIRKSQKVLFEDRVQYLDGGTLDDLIFQRGNPERPKLARFTHLRDVHPADRLCSVGSPLEPMGEILEVRLEGLAVVLPRFSVHARSCVLLNRQERYPQSFDVVNVVEERSEPLFLVPSCCLTYPLKRAGRAFPALSPERVALGRVPLGPSPSLHCLRCRSLGFVRQLRRFYETVRLPASVRHRRASFDFPIRSAVLSSADRRGISRFPDKVLAYMHGVSDRAGSWHPLRWRCTQCCLPTISRASASRSTCCLRSRACISRLNTRPVRSPVNASTLPSRTAPHDSGPLWSPTPSTYETFIHYTLPV